jgi:hypothetical protein
MPFESTPIGVLSAVDSAAGLFEMHRGQRRQVRLADGAIGSFFAANLDL